MCRDWVTIFFLSYDDARLAMFVIGRLEEVVLGGSHYWLFLMAD